MFKHSYNLLSIGIVTVVTGLCFSMHASAQNIQINQEDQLNLKRLYNDTAKRTVDSYLEVRGIANAKKSIVSSTLTFDLDRLNKDAAEYRRKIVEQRWQTLQESKNQIFKVPTSPKNSDVNSKVGAHRFGRLNIDLEASTLEKMLDSVSAPTDGVSLSYSLPFMSDISPFSFRAADYLSKLSLTVQLPESIPETLYADLTTSVQQTLQLDQIAKGTSTEDWVKIDKIAPLPAEAKPSLTQTWITGLLSPQNATLGILVACLILGIFLLTATLLLAKVFARVASGIASLAPEKETTSSDGPEIGEMSVAASTPEIVAVETSSHEESKYDHQASTQALTTEMRTIRDQFMELLEGNENLVAELIRDIFYEDNGLSDLRDVISFLGYKAMRGILNKLPQESMNRLKTFMDENRDDTISLLNGVDTTQRVYRDAVMRLAVVKEDLQLDRIRDFLVQTDDATLQQTLPSFNPRQIALVIKSLTVERSNTVVKSIPIETLKEAAKILDDDVGDATLIVDEMISALETASQNTTTTSNEQLQFVIRLAKSATIADEENVLAMVGPEDWDIARRVMETKYLFAQLSLLPIEFIKSVFDSVATGQRAEYLVICDQQIREGVLGIYTGKLKELLENEINLINNNQNKLAEVMARKQKIAHQMMGLIRERLKSRPTVIADALRNRAQAEGTELPEYLKVASIDSAQTTTDDEPSRVDEVSEGGEAA